MLLLTLMFYNFLRETLQSFFKSALRDLIQMGILPCYSHVEPVCNGQIVTTKLHAWMRSRLASSASSIADLRGAIDGAVLRESRRHLISVYDAARVLCAASLCSIRKQAICLKLFVCGCFCWCFFPWHDLVCVPPLLFVLDECWGNGLIMLTCW